jgi:hypothetical protein
MADDFEDARAIMTPGHPQHEMYLKEQGTGPLSDKIAAAYAAKYGDAEVSLSGGISNEPKSDGEPATENPSSTKDLNVQTLPPQSGVEVTKAQLKAEWGSEYDQQIQYVGVAEGFLFEGREHLVEEIVNAGLHVDPEMMRVMAKFGKHLSKKVQL